VLVGSTLGGLARGAIVATGSVRRRVQLAGLRPDLSFRELRGNIDTRLAAVGAVDAIVMAQAALDRLEREVGVHDILEPDVMVPQVGQGALAVECRSSSAALEAVAVLDDADARRVYSAERSFLVVLGGDCDLPAGAHASLLADGTVTMVAMLATADDVPRRATGRDVDGDALGARLASELLRTSS
jgi:hydroxymethylbilane synthase